jgi:hypothetical protein
MSLEPILFEPSYYVKTETTERLQQFITANGYEIAGLHEEEYQSKSDAKVIKTLIRYQVKKKSQQPNKRACEMAVIACNCFLQHSI